MNQENQEKVSCLCVTNNRVGMLSNSIKYFDAQDYINKELIVLFDSSDSATKNYAASWEEVNNIKLEVTKEAKNTFFIYAANGDKSLTALLGGEFVKFNSAGGSWLSISSEGKLAGSSDDRLNQCSFQLEKSGGMFKIKSGQSRYLSVNSNGTISLVRDFYKASLFQINSIEGNRYSIQTSEGTFVELCEETGRAGHGYKIQKNEFGNPNAKIKFIEIKGDDVSLGLKRNIGIQYATGSYVAIWDDDDWYAPERLSVQLEALSNCKKAACTLTRLYMFDHSSKRAYATSARRIGWEGSLVCQKEFMVNYDHVQKGEDTSVLVALLRAFKLKVIMEPQLYIYNVHGNNTWNREHFQQLIGSSVQLDSFKSNWVKERALTPIEKIEINETNPNEEFFVEGAVG